MAERILKLSASCVVPAACTTLEFDVIDVDTRVNNVRPGTLAGTGVVCVVLMALLAVRNGAETPGGLRLRGQAIELPDLILLNFGDLTQY